MTSLVENFIINPVLRQARRFSSSPFATTPNPERLRRLSHGSRLQVEDAVAEWDEDRDEDDLVIRRLAQLRIQDAPLGSITPPLLIPRPRTSAGYTENEVSHHAIAITGQTMDHIAEMGGTNSPLPVRDFEIPIDTINNEPDIEPDTAPDPDDRKIPADDGKRALRRRILDIQSRDIASEEKARLMHGLLTEGYIEAKRVKTIAKTHDKPAALILKSGSPPSPTIWDDPLGAVGHLRFWSATNKTSSIPTTSEDRQPTYMPLKPRIASKDSEALDGMEGAQDLTASIALEDTLRPLGCEHYKRNVKLQCATCEKWYTCRLCHDAEEDHILPRKETKHMLCMMCGFPQLASDCCVNCNNTSAQYYCNVCKLWNDDVKKQFYHCDDCGICRVGHGLDKDFFHCNTCRACIAVGNREGHKCIERVTDCDCPICGDHMFSSQRTVIFMDCGHCIHNDCWKLHLQSSYKCPICSKSCVNMETAFRNLDNAIREQPMPEGFHNLKCVILCNDCSAKGPTDFHFLGLKCQTCRSYNTVELQRLPPPGAEDEAESTEADGHHDNMVQGEPAATARLPVQNIWPQDGVSWNHMSGLASAAQSPGLPGHVMDDVQAGPSQNHSQPAGTRDDDEEDIDFWGRDGMSDEDDDGGSDSGEDDEDDEDDDENYDEEDDNEGDFILFGHR